MKIQSITRVNYPVLSCYRKNYISTSPEQPKVQTFDDRVLKDLTHNKISINFTSSLPVKPQKLSLDEKLSFLFRNELTDGDLVVVAKNLEQVKKVLKKNIKSFDNLLDRIFFIKDSGLSVPLAFNICKDVFTFVYNLGDKNILVATERDTKTLPAGGNLLIGQDDVIINNKRTISIDFEQNKEDIDLLSAVDNFFYFVPSRQKNTENFNLSIIERISETKELINEEVPQSSKKLSFKDVGGLDDVIKQLKKGIVYPIKKPFAFKNSTLNHGFLFYGPPGTGKTLLGKALANEINAAYIELNGLEMEDSLVGISEKNWRKLFENAKANQPCVLFIDEFDAVAKVRNGKDVHGDKVVNQILTLITDVDTNNDQVFIIAATNMPEKLDPAIVRPGRIGKHIEIPAPNVEGLSQIFDIHSRAQNLDENLDKDVLIEEFSKKKFTGADVRAILSDAQEKAWERLGIYEKMEDDSLTPEDIEKVVINQEDFRKALDEFVPVTKKNNRNPIGFNKQ